MDTKWAEYPHETRLRLQQAAAPDLYEALSALRERTWLIVGVNDAAIKSADAALAKARGEIA